MSQRSEVEVRLGAWSLIPNLNSLTLGHTYSNTCYLQLLAYTSWTFLTAFLFA
jgi:hypothetical protein